MKRIMVGSYVMVKYGHRYTSPVSSNRTHTVLHVQGALVLLKGHDTYLPLDMFELYKG